MADSELLLRLFEEVRNGFARVDERFERMDERFEHVNERFEHVNERFERLDERFERMDERFERMDERFERLDEKIERIDETIEHVDEKIEHIDIRTTKLGLFIGTLESHLTRVEQTLVKHGTAIDRLTAMVKQQGAAIEAHDRKIDKLNVAVADVFHRTHFLPHVAGNRNGDG
jgi:chromosome segregation ATPase